MPPKKTPEVYEPAHGGRASRRVDNIPVDADEIDLKELFGCFGPVHRASVARNVKTGESKGTGMVNFKNKTDAEAARAKLDGYPYGNLILRVDWA
jgi:translation initiation factor 3 subunit G